MCWSNLYLVAIPLYCNELCPTIEPCEKICVISSTVTNNSSKAGFAPNGIKSLKIGSPVNKSLGQCGRLVRYRDVVGRAPWHRDITHQGVSGYRRNPPSPNRLDVTLKVRILNKILPIMMMKTIWHWPSNVYDLLAQGAEYNTKRANWPRVWKYLGTSLLPRRFIIYWGAVEIFGGSSLRQFKTTANGSWPHTASRSYWSHTYQTSTFSIQPESSF